MFDTELHRRRFLLVAGTTTMIGLAGCTTAPPTSDQQGSGGETTTSTTETEHDEGMDDHMDDESEDHVDEEEEDHGHMMMVGEPVDHADVEMATTDEGYHFTPHVVWVNAGGSVQWTNVSGFHSTTSYSPENNRPQLMPDGAEPWNSDVFTEGTGTFEHTFDVEGVYHYFCIPHEELGMIGSVIVGNPDPHDQPALGEPPAEFSDTVRETLMERNAMVTEALGHDE